MFPDVREVGVGVRSSVRLANGAKAVSASPLEETSGDAGLEKVQADDIVLALLESPRVETDEHMGLQYEFQDLVPDDLLGPRGYEEVADSDGRGDVVEGATQSRVERRIAFGKIVEDTLVTSVIGE